MNARIHLLVFFAVATTAICIGAANSRQSQKSSADRELDQRVAKLEKRVAKLAQQFKDEKLVSELSGRWLEEDYVVSGTKVQPIDDVEWRLSSQVSCDRYVLSPEVSMSSFGEFSVDTSTNPTSINFQYRQGKRTVKVKGIVRTSFGKAEIVIPTKLFANNMYLNPDRPTEFESTAENKNTHFKLIRGQYKRTGVWK